jgi:hypothetical protein
VSRFIFQQSKIPAFNSAFGKKLAKTLWDLRLYFGDHRKERERWVKECDAAYLCHRYVPDTGGIELIEDGEFGESDIHDAANIISIRLALALMPRNEPWLTVSSRDGEAEKITQGLTDLQMFLHRKARTRRQVQRAIKGGVIRGSIYMHYDWDDKYRLRRLTDAENAPEIEKFLTSSGLSKKDAKAFTRGRHKELIFSGPVVTPIDFYDVWIQPRVDLLNERPATILQRFRQLSALKAEIDENDKPLYKNLDDVEPWDLEELENNTDLAGGRGGSDRLGSAPLRHYRSNVKLVPVYIFHLPYFELDGYEFWDTYFHVALSSKNSKPHLIRVEENPNDLGLNHLLIDHYIDFHTNEPYGISGVQYQLSKYHQKNFMQLLTVTAAAHSIFPPSLYMQNAFRDEDDLTFYAGGTIPVQENPLGLEVVKQLPMPDRGAQFGEQTLRFWAEEIRAGTGVDGLSTNNAARNLSSRKTATEVNSDNTAGSFFLDNQAENLQDLLTELVTGVFQLTQYRLKPSDENPNIVEYEKYLGDKVIQDTLQLADVQAKRSVQVRGITGQLNKEQETNNLLNMFQIAGQIPDPRMNAVKMYLAQKLANKLNVPLPPEMMMSPVELVATNPEVQMAALQNALQNPQVQAVAAQMMGGGQPQQQGEPAGGIAQGQSL